MCSRRCSKELDAQTHVAVATNHANSHKRMPELGWVLACVCVPVVMLCAVCAWSGVYPFGDESFLDDDLLYQYVDFFSWFRRVLLGEGSLFYSFSQTLGVNTWNQYSYYLGSPLNLLVVFFDEAHLTDAVFVIDAIKLSLMQLSWSWFLRRRLTLSRLDSFVVALSITWCGWVSSNLMNPLWLDMLYLLPLMMLGCWALVREGKWALLLVSTTCSIVFCWYMGYMSCVFAVLYVLFEAYAAHVEDASLAGGFFLRRALRFAACMIGALALSAWTFLPTVLAMMGSGRAWEMDPFELRCGVLDLLASFFVGTFRSEETPQVFAGTLPLVLYGMFLFDRRIDLRIRLASVVLLIIGCASTMLAVVEFVWCGFRVPNAFYSRTAFLIPVVLAWGSGCELREIRVHGSKMRVVVGVSVALVGIIALGYLRNKFDAPIDAFASAVAVVVVCALVVLLARMPREGMAVLLTAALACFGTLELVRDGHVQWRQLYTGVSQQHQIDYAMDSRAQLNELKALDPGVWRMDKTYTRAWLVALNEGIARGYKALSSYTSTMDMRSVDLLCALGYSTPGEFCLRYGGPVAPSDSLLGIRYMASQGGCPALYEETPVAVGMDGARVYKNPSALGLGYGVSQDALAALTTTGNPFEAQNELVSALLGRKVELYKPLVAELATSSDTLQTWSVSIPANTVGCAYVIGDRMEGSSAIGWLGLEGADVTEQGTRFSYHVVGLGKVKDEARTRVVRLASSAEAANGEAAPADVPLLAQNATCLLYGMDVETYNEILGELGAHQFEPERFDDGYVTGSYEAPNDGWLMMTFPTDKGWTVSVNGETVSTQDALGGAFTAIPVRQGSNRVEMRFVPRGFVVGCAISAVALIGVVALSVVSKRRARPIM